MLYLRIIVCDLWLFSPRARFDPLGFLSETAASMWASLSARRTAYASPLKWILLGREFSSEIFVSGLSYYTTDKEFRAAFLPFGNVKEARLIRDARTKRPKGYGFVTYESEAEVQKAIKAMDGRIFGGRLIFVETAKPRSEEDTPWAT